MFVFSNLIYAIAVVLRILIEFTMFTIVFSTIYSWFPTMGNGRVLQFFREFSGLFVNPLRKRFPRMRYGVVDFSPLITILLLVFIDQFVISSLFDLSNILR